MKSPLIRLAVAETDALGITAMINECKSASDTVDEVRTWLQRYSPGRSALHRVCVNEEDAVIGYGNIIHMAESRANLFYAWVGVSPAYRCQGIGSALWTALLDDLHAQGATQVVGEILEKAPPGLEFAKKRGFVIDRHQYPSTLDLATFDETPFLPVVTELESAGMRFCTLADFPDDPHTQRRYYELNLATVRDIPGEYWDFAMYPQFFQERILGAPWFRRENQILAVEGETFAGFASVSLSPETQSAYNETTGVLPAYRGRKIGLALKVLAARFARQHGARQVGTDNDSLNAPILAINRKMGYQPQPGKYIVIRELG
jgi:GNAT superfamily N-acetyltransferase